MNELKYLEFGELLVKLRKSKGWMQQEFALRAGVAQQTVSRWERGLSRPRAKELPNLASLLDSDLGVMEAAAKYALAQSVKNQIAGAPTYDTLLPLQSLQPESFENFSADFLRRYYRDRSGVVNRFGGTGSKQFGIDIEVRGDHFGVHTFQCKRVQEFGEQKVHTAVAAHNYTSALKVLLLSNIASPKARLAIAQHPGWQLWDSVDISSKFRELPMIDRRDLVDIYFRGQRQSLLGEPEPGPFQKPEYFFKGFTQPNRYFNHSWSLVGREEELEQLTANILDDDLLVTMLLGPPGNGKTRLLREVVDRVCQRRPDINVLFVSPTESVKAQHLEELGVGAKLLIADDAHDRDDLAQLMRYTSAPDNKAKLLLSLRSYGRPMVRSQATLVAMDSPQIAAVELRPRTKHDAYELAIQVLKDTGGPLEAAEEIAELTYTTPLVTVLAAQIVAKENTPLTLIGNCEDFQRHVLDKFEKILTGQIVTGQDIPKLQAVLRIVALLQPVVFDDPGFLNILREVEGLEYEDAQRLLRLLSEGGVLFKRGLRHRLAPDLLADSIIQSNYIGANDTVTPKVEKVFDLADSQYLQHLLVNLGRLDWRLRNGVTEGSKLLSSIAPKLKWHNKYHNPHIEAVEAVAYYQPQLALRFAKQLIDQKHGDDAGVCGMLRNIAFNLDMLEDSCAQLWRAGKSDDRALNQHPSHGIRILKELAEFAPNKPVECVERVVAFAIDLLDRPASLHGAYTPFSILEGALGTNMEEVTQNDRYRITITQYHLQFNVAKNVRRRVIDTIIRSIEKGPPRKAFLAAKLISEALRSPMHNGEDSKVWDAAHAELLERLYQALQSPEVHPLVLVRAGMSVSWHALYGNESESSARAQAIIGLLDRDLHVRLIRLFADAWGGETWKDDNTFQRKAHEADIIKMMADLDSEFPEPTLLYEFLNYWLHDMNEIAGKGWGAPQIFINRLLKYRTDLSKVVMVNQADTKIPMSHFAGSALAVLMEEEQSRHTFISKLLEDDSVRTWELVSDAYARLPENLFTDSDVPVVRQIMQSHEPVVLRNAASISRRIARHNPALAVELMCIADFTVDSVATHEFFMCLAHRGTIPTEAITEEQWHTLLQRLSQMPELDDHWIGEFLKKAVATFPANVIAMLKTRLQSNTRSFGHKALRGDRSGEGFGLISHPDGRKLLKEFLSWAVDAKADCNITDIGVCVSGLCGKYGPELMSLLLEIMKGGQQAQVDVVASVLRKAHQEFVVEQTPFIREILNQAELIGEEAVRDISDALWSAAISGGRSGVVGEPFDEDLILQSHSETILCGLSKVDPAYQLYSELLEFARQNIGRQAREKHIMVIEDE